MSVQDEARIAPLPAGSENFTAIRFVPDLSRFGIGARVPTPLHEAQPRRCACHTAELGAGTLDNADTRALLTRRVYEAAACVAPARVYLDGEQAPCSLRATCWPCHLPAR